jgi:Lar family restriction alleviation protein
MPALTPLLPCPFCGGKAIMDVDEANDEFVWHSVGCGECNCLMDQASDSAEDAARVWNRRATPAGHDAVERVAELQQAVGVLQEMLSSKEMQALPADFTLRTYRLVIDGLNDFRYLRKHHLVRIVNATAALASVSAHQSVEPTQEQVQAGIDRYQAVAKSGEWTGPHGIIAEIYRAMTPPGWAAQARDALTQAEACMSIVEPRSDKAEYLRILGVVRAALASAAGGTGEP